MVTFTPAAQSCPRAASTAWLLSVAVARSTSTPVLGGRASSVPQLGDGEGVDLTFDAQLP